VGDELMIEYYGCGKPAGKKPLRRPNYFVSPQEDRWINAGTGT